MFFPSELQELKTGYFPLSLMKVLSQSGPFTNLYLIVIRFLFSFYGALYYF